MNKIVVFLAIVFLMSAQLAFAFEERATAVSFNSLRDTFVKEINVAYDTGVKAVQNIPKVIVPSLNISDVSLILKNTIANNVNFPKLISGVNNNFDAGFGGWPRFNLSISSSVYGILKPFSDFVDFLKDLIYPKPQMTDTQANNVTLLAGNNSVNRSYEDSPFGVSGAYSRPYIADDNASRQDVYQKINELKTPYEHVQDIGAKWVRPGIDITWPLVQRSREDVENGVFDWTITDKLYGQVPEGVNVLANIGVDRGLKQNSWEFVDKQAESYYTTYIKAIIERYDGDGNKDMPGLENPIKYWQIGNEPAFILGKLLRSDKNAELDWKSFRRLHEITCGAIKENDPEAKVVIGGMAFGHLVNSSRPEALLYKKEVESFYLPIINSLQSNCVDFFDIHYYGAFGEDRMEYKGMKDVYSFIRSALDKAGFQNTKIWFTETASPSKPFGEKAQAIELVKRFIYPISFGAEKVFWWNMIEGEYPLEDDKPSDHFGLVYDGIGKDDPGYGVKKLAYYSYKKMVDILEGSDWNSVVAVQGGDSIYIYKLNRANQSIWVAWSENGADRQIQIGGVNSSRINITESVPKYESGKEVKNYYNAFNGETKTVNNGSVTLDVGRVPVFITEE